MHRSLLFLLLFVSVHTLHAQISQTQVIVLGANEAPPYWAKKMPYNGMAGEIIEAISKVQGIKTKIKFKPLTRLIHDDENNDLGNPEFFIPYQEFEDIITIAIYHTSFYKYEYNHEKNKIMDSHNHEKYNFKSLHELKGKKIGLIKGASMGKNVFEIYGAILETSYSQASLFKKLKLGRLDYVLSINLVAQDVIQKNFSNEEEDFIPLEIKGLSNPIAIMIAQEQKDARVYSKKFKEGLKTIILNGTYENIVKKYYKSKTLPDNWFKDLERFNQLYQIEEDN